MVGSLRALITSAMHSQKADYQSRVGPMAAAIMSVSRGQQPILAQDTIHSVPSKLTLPSNPTLRDTTTKFRRQKHLVNRKVKLSSSISINMLILWTIPLKRSLTRCFKAASDQMESWRAGRRADLRTSLTPRTHQK